MAFSMGGGGGTRGRGRFRNQGTLAEINIVPLVDVVLVLLIIFMLTAHVMEYGIEVDVPKTKQGKESAEILPVLTIDKDGNMNLNDKPINLNDIANQVHTKFSKSKAVYVRADKATVWDPIAQVISTLGAAKIDVRVVTQPEDSGSQKRP
jgi:biopolymer transport protein ExbD